MPPLIEEVVESLAKLQLVHGMSAGECLLILYPSTNRFLVNDAIARYRENLDDSARALFTVDSSDDDALTYTSADTTYVPFML